MFYTFVTLSAFVAAAFAQAPPTTLGVITPGVNGGLCLAALDNADGAQIVVETCTGAESQIWNFTLVDNGASVTVSAFNNTKCLDATNGIDEDGILTQLWTCTEGDANQEWFYTGDNRLSWVNEGKCLDLTSGEQNPGTTHIQIWTCTDDDVNQIWDVTAI